ncbi:unnamed protein product [Ranitomeya imitator]|uniref:E3 ubiquitin-protein ligase n=1 Tax=Ranitomeya imitator TaxID=111125 RepID=A0ABN9L8L0_9NEOB|nr:unnamed protein product [Ranitomeya imitator]
MKFQMAYKGSWTTKTKKSPMSLTPKNIIDYSLLGRDDNWSGAPAQAYFVCPVEGRAKYCSAQAPGLSDLSRRLRTAILCSALNRTKYACAVKTRRGRHRYIGGLCTAFQNAVDKPLMPVAAAHLRFLGVGDPHPGCQYRGGKFEAYLPDNREGKKLLALLQKALDEGLIFHIKTFETGEKVTWYKIPHKTSPDGGKQKFIPICLVCISTPSGPMKPELSITGEVVET